MVQLKRLRAHTELIHTGDDHSPLVFLSLDQSFLGTRFQEYSQVRFVEDQRGDWEGPGWQF